MIAIPAHSRYLSMSNDTWELPMLSEVRVAAPIVTVEGPTPRRSRISPRVLSMSRRAWTWIIDAVSGPGLEGGGIDDSRYPSSFMVTHGRGSRQVRGLWPQPF